MNTGIKQRVKQSLFLTNLTFEQKSHIINTNKPANSNQKNHVKVIKWMTLAEDTVRALLPMFT